MLWLLPTCGRGVGPGEYVSATGGKMAGLPVEEVTYLVDGVAPSGLRPAIALIFFPRPLVARGCV